MRVNGVLNVKGHEVITIPPATTVAACARLLRDHRIGALVVSSSGETVDGLVSERDIVTGLADHGPAFLERPVARVMTARPHSCTLDDHLEHLMALMTVERVRHVPVVEHGRLVGIVSIGDVVKQRLSELESEQQVLREYITTGR